MILFEHTANNFGFALARPRISRSFRSGEEIAPFAVGEPAAPSGQENSSGQDSLNFARDK
jgi:hypothetical protein